MHFTKNKNAYLGVMLSLFGLHALSMIKGNQFVDKGDPTGLGLLFIALVCVVLEVMVSVARLKFLGRRRALGWLLAIPVANLILMGVIYFMKERTDVNVEKEALP